MCTVNQLTPSCKLSSSEPAENLSENMLRTNLVLEPGQKRLPLEKGCHLEGGRGGLDGLQKNKKGISFKVVKSNRFLWHLLGFMFWQTWSSTQLIGKEES